jgi:hypothetical protein
MTMVTLEASEGLLGALFSTERLDGPALASGKITVSMRELLSAWPAPNPKCQWGNSEARCPTEVEIGRFTAYSKGLEPQSRPCYVPSISMLSRV